jgi:hypothetical protein
VTIATNRSPYLIASAFVGASLGLIAYRYGVLPFIWNSSFGFLFPGLAVGFGFAARSLVRAADVERKPGMVPRMMCGLVGLAVAMGIAFWIAPPIGYAKLTVRKFPGFSIALPPTEVVSESSEYQVGKTVFKGLPARQPLLLAGIVSF